MDKNTGKKISTNLSSVHSATRASTVAQLLQLLLDNAKKSMATKVAKDAFKTA